MVSIGIIPWSVIALIAAARCGPASAFAGGRLPFATSHRILAGRTPTRLRSSSDGSEGGEMDKKGFISSIEKLVRDDDGSQTLILTTARKQRMQDEIGLLVRANDSLQ